MSSGRGASGSGAGSGDPSIRRTWWLLALAFLVLGLASAARVVETGAFGDWLLLVIVAVAALAAMAHRNAVVRLEASGRGEAEGFARILRGLSRSVSADAIVSAIMDDLVDATGVDHAVLVRRRADGTALEATLVTRRAGVPPTTTVLPIADLEAAAEDGNAPLPMAGLVAAPSPTALPSAAPPSTAASPPAASRTATPPRLEANHARPLVRRFPDGGNLPVAVGPGHPPAAPAAIDAAPAMPRHILTSTRRPEFRAGDQPRDRAAALLRRGLAEGLALLRDLGLPIPARRARAGSRRASVVLARGDDATVVARIADRVRHAFGLTNTLTVPLVADARMSGAIVLSRRGLDPWEDQVRRILRGAAAETSAALARADTYREATARAWTDALTGLPNRRYFEESCRLMAQRRRAGDAVAVLMIDIDRFKALNDTYGHPAGDEVLRAVAGAIARTVRDQDVPARVGGEEFAVLLRNPGPAIAVEVGERVREEVGQLDLRRLGVHAVTVSVGVAQADDPDEPIAEVVERADRALLKAKRAGRNRVVAAGRAVRA